MRRVLVLVLVLIIKIIDNGKNEVIINEFLNVDVMDLKSSILLYKYNAIRVVGISVKYVIITKAGANFKTSLNVLIKKSMVRIVPKVIGVVAAMELRLVFKRNFIKIINNNRDIIEFKDLIGFKYNEVPEIKINA